MPDSPRPQAYITTVQVWVDDEQTIVMPFLGVHAGDSDARQNAIAGATLLLTEQAPQHLDKRITVSPVPLPDATTRAFVERLARERPDLLPGRVERGKRR